MRDVDRSLVSALAEIDRHGDLKGGDTPAATALREIAVRRNLAFWDEDRERFVLTSQGRGIVSGKSVGTKEADVIPFRRKEG